jgi:hypothetical protein
MRRPGRLCCGDDLRARLVEILGALSKSSIRRTRLSAVRSMTERE